MHKSIINTPLGNLQVTAGAGHITSVHFTEEATNNGSLSPLLNECKAQIDAFFAGTLREFDLPLALTGTPFQQDVLREVMNIPFGKTVSYLDIARKLGDDKKVRAVGTANGNNQLLLLIPCHRVIGSNGDPVGYAGGLQRKQWLLQHERDTVAAQLPLF